MNAELLNRLSQQSKSSLVGAAKYHGVALGDYARKSKDEIIGLLMANVDEKQLAATAANMLVQSAPVSVLPGSILPVAGANAASSLVDAIRAIAGDSINEESVREIIKQELANVPEKVVEKIIFFRDAVKVEAPGGEHIREELQDVVDFLTQGCNVMLVGPSGSGKSHFAEQVSRVLGLPFSANSCSAGMSESALSGWLLPVEEGGKFVYVAASFVNAYEHGGLHLIDEIDAADANTLVFINAALANGKFHLPQRHENPIVNRHENFRCIAAANTFGQGADRMYVAREQMDASSLDRFWMVEFGYDSKLEEKMVDDTILSWGRELRAKVSELRLRRVVSTRKLIEATRLTRAGMKFDTVKKSFFAPWSSDERSKIGLAA